MEYLYNKLRMGERTFFPEYVTVGGVIMTVFSKHRQNIYIMGLINQAERLCVLYLMLKRVSNCLSAVTKLRNHLNMTLSGLPFNYELNKMLYQVFKGLKKLPL